jgi:uncharacterized protein (DUF1684 family)
VNEDQNGFAARWEIWHKEFEARRSRPHGFLSITAMHWLTQEPTRFDEVPGAWSSGASDVRVHLNSNEELTVEDVRISEYYEFVDVDEEGQWATFDDRLVEVCRRDGQFMIRPRDPNNPVRTGYKGTPTFPPNIEWLVNGTFRSYEETQSIHVGASVEGMTQVYESNGEIEFEVGGQVLRLIAFHDHDPQELFIVFTDQTAGSSTYPACRFLDTDAPDSEGLVVLDFNRATNPPCAYTDFATCPLPPSGNHLNIKVEAGEMVASKTL